MENKFIIKTTKPKITIATTKATKLDVVVNKPIINAKRSKAFFQLKNTGGPTGAKGEKGDPGQAATITAGTATSLPAGSTPTVVNSGTSTNAVFNFGIPKGDKGDTGDTGAPGQAATISVGSTTTGAPGTNASVTNVGTSSAAVLNFTVPRGATGATGAPGTPGAPGQAATVNVGTTTTGAAGTSASVTNSGTSSAAVLNFTIPKGDKGDAGSAATITVGNTTTGNPGTNASVVNTGTSSAAVLDFTIPKGAKGDPGNPGTAATIAVGTTSTLPAGSSATVTNSGTSSAAVFDFGVPKGDKGDTGNPGSAATVTVGTVTTGAPGTSATVVNSGTSSAAVFDFTIPRGDKGESGSGAGDMLAADYDPNGTVQNAGGIVDYVDGVLPTVNNATLTIQQNGTNVQTFTANQATNATANITVPTKTSELTNDTGFIDAVAWGDITGTLSDQTDLNTALGAKANSADLATVATSGSYNDLSNKPSIPAAQVNSDWSANSGVAQILNKPTLATVATTGSYNDLSDTPTLATVATSGSYDDLSDKPTIPAAQVNSDWNANSGKAQILNKPTLATVATTGAYSDLTGTPTIPTVNDATLTIQKNGTNVQTFTANQSTNATANITVPTATSDLTNDGADGTDTYVETADIANFITAEDIASTSALTPPVQTNMIADSAVTADKIDWSDMVVVAPKVSSGTTMSLVLTPGTWKISGTMFFLISSSSSTYQNVGLVIGTEDRRQNVNFMAYDSAVRGNFTVIDTVTVTASHIAVVLHGAGTLRYASCSLIAERIGA